MSKLNHNTRETLEHDDGEAEAGVLVAEPRTRTKRPPFYKVVLLNDDFTPMDFVVLILENIFHLQHEKAMNIMLEVHQKGAGVCGRFTRDVAETKVDAVLSFARKHEHPLQCVMERDED